MFEKSSIIKTESQGLHPKICNVHPIHYNVRLNA